MEYQILFEGKVIGVTKLEAADPPMGFVSGAVNPTNDYQKDLDQNLLSLTRSDVVINCESISIEDLSEEMGETCIEVTALLESSDEFEKHFKHHSENYENQYK